MNTASLPTADLVVLVAYILGIALLGCWFLRTSRTSRDFMIAGRGLPGWAVGLSIFATFLSSNTFLGVPGKAYATNWNAFVFSLSLPIAAWIAVRYFVPFYRRGCEISAYAHLERRFGPWARLYAITCYLLTQLARMGAILFGTALALQALLGWRMQTIILTIGVVATVYTVLGGIRAVIWTDVVQSMVLISGAGIILLLIFRDMPGGPGEAIAIAAEHGKFGLGGFSASIRTSTFWVVLLYGLFVNLTNFGIDQNYVQRYHTAESDRAAARGDLKEAGICAIGMLPGGDSAKLARNAACVAENANRINKTKKTVKVGEDLAKSCPKQGGTYKLVDPKSGEVKRTGQTIDLKRRKGEHKRGQETKDLDFVGDKLSNDLDQRLGREQILHDTHKPPLNKRNPISPRNPRRNDLIEKGRELGD